MCIFVGYSGDLCGVGQLSVSFCGVVEVLGGPGEQHRGPLAQLRGGQQLLGQHAQHSGGHVVQLGEDPQGHEDTVEKKTSSVVWLSARVMMCLSTKAQGGLAVVHMVVWVLVQVQLKLEYSE